MISVSFMVVNFKSKRKAAIKWHLAKLVESKMVSNFDQKKDR